MGPDLPADRPAEHLDLEDAQDGPEEFPDEFGDAEDLPDPEEVLDDLDDLLKELDEELRAVQVQVLAAVRDTVESVVPASEREAPDVVASAIMRQVSELASRQGRQDADGWSRRLDLVGVRLSSTQVVQELQALTYSVAMITIEVSCSPVAASELTMAVERAASGRARRFLMGMSTGAPLPDSELLRERQSLYESAGQSVVGLANVLLAVCYRDAGLALPDEFSNIELIEAMKVIGPQMGGAASLLVATGWAAL